MSYNTATWVYPSTKKGGVFSGGIVSNTPNTHLENHLSPYSINFRLDGQSVTKRPGYQTFVTVGGSGYPRGITSYLRADPTLNRIVVRQNVDATHDLVSITEAGVQTDISTGSDITTDARMSFVNIADTLYCMNGTDFGKLDGVSYTNIPVGTSHLPVAPKFGTFFAGCQWVGGFTGSSSNKVYKSPTNSFEDFTASGSDFFTFPETVNALNVGGQAIFTFTTNTIHTCTLGDQVETAGVITFSFKPIQATEGAISNASVVSVGSNVYYLSSSNKINMIARGSNVYGFEVVELSDREYEGITPLLNSLAVDQSDSFAQYYPEQSLIKWFLKSKGATFNDTCIIYDVERDMFLQDTAKYFYDAAYLNGQVYTISTITPTVFRDEYGRDDDGGGIFFDYWTKAFDEGEYTLKKTYWESRADVRISELASLTQEIYLNNEINIYGDITGTLIDTKTINSSNIDLSIGGIGTGAIGTFPIGLEGTSSVSEYPVTILRTKGNLNARGYSIQFRYTDSAIGSTVKLLRLGYKMEVLPGITTNLTS